LAKGNAPGVHKKYTDEAVLFRLLTLST
jgi:hypothetical protein